jgi:hypothetical protein
VGDPGTARAANIVSVPSNLQDGNETVELSDVRLSFSSRRRIEEAVQRIIAETLSPVAH